MQGAVEAQQLDLADLSSVRRFADILQAEPTIDMLILNAGVAGTPQTYTKDNFELQVGTNHFGHFVLVDSLLQKLKQQVSSFLTFSYHRLGMLACDGNALSPLLGTWVRTVSIQACLCTVQHFLTLLQRLVPSKQSFAGFRIYLNPKF